MTPEPFEVDPSHALDLVTLFSSANHDAEMEANAIHGVLEANSIPSLVVGAPQIHSLEFHVQVPRAHLEEARAAILKRIEPEVKKALIEQGDIVVELAEYRGL